MNVHRIVLRSLLVLLYLVKLAPSKLKNKPESGPFRTVLTDVESCLTEDSQVGADKIMFYPQVTNSSKVFIKGNITVSDFKDVKLNISLIGRNGEKFFDVKNMNCHNTLVDIIFTAIKLPFNKKNCYIAPGSYTFQGVDLNKCIHKFIKTTRYGHIQMTINIFKVQKTKRVDIACILLIGEHKPL